MVKPVAPFPSDPMAIYRLRDVVLRRLAVESDVCPDCGGELERGLLGWICGYKRCWACKRHHGTA